MENSLFQATCLSTTTIRISAVCTVCGSRPACMNFGAICCPSCKMFFRRNETFELSNSRCRFNTVCDVSRDNRRACRHCRLSKCFAVGMKRELFRSAHANNTPHHQNRKQVIYPLDLLLNDQSALTTTQWGLLSNIISSYDTKCPVDAVRKSIHIEANYPAKMRMKVASSQFMNLVSSYYVLLVQFLQDISYFDIISKNDRNILLERSLPNLDALNGLLILRELNLHNHHEFTSCAIATYGLSVIQNIHQHTILLDKDGTLLKLLIVVLSFSTCYNTVHLKDDINNGSIPYSLLSEPGEVLLIQNIYVEVMFKYMLYRCGYQEAALRFANLIKIVMDQNQYLEEARDVPHTINR